MAGLTKRRASLAGVVLGLALVLAGCEEPSPQPRSTVAARPAGPTTLMLEPTSPGMAEGRFIDLVTNLPDATKLMVTLHRAGAARIAAQDDQVVYAGKIRFGPFGTGSVPLKVGAYDVSVTAPLSDMQTDAVRAAVGDGYARFSSPDIRQGRFGRVIERRFTVRLGGAAAR